MKNKQSQVIELLTANGWLPDGHTMPNTYKIITIASYPLAGGLVQSGGHPRFVKDAWKVSAGKRIVYFYKPDKEKPYYKWDGVGFGTKDLQGIEDWLKVNEGGE